MKPQKLSIFATNFGMNDAALILHTGILPVNLIPYAEYGKLVFCYVPSDIILR